MNSLYVNGMFSISAQPEDIFSNGEEALEYRENILVALEQDYRSMIKPMSLRRMSKAVKMGLFCSRKALSQAGEEMPDAILVGTGQGCLQDTEKFLKDMLQTNEGLLSPTSFIQSTHNTVGGQIALDLDCKGLNLSFTQNSVSFETALLNAMLMMEDETMSNILVGGVEETSTEFSGFQKLDGQIKKEKVKNLGLFRSDSPGTIVSESAAFFVLGSNRTPTSFARLAAVEIFNSCQEASLNSQIEAFLQANKISAANIDAVILGRNGDIRFDHYYDILQNGIFSNTCQLGFKHLVGENNSVSSYAFMLASRILQKGKVPEVFRLNHLNCEEPGYILIYNQYLGKNHGLILLQKP